jgi:hypothetical protein
MLNLSTRCRAWFAALLLLALPLQGYAAASMVACSVGGSSDWLAAVAQASTVTRHVGSHEGDPVQHARPRQHAQHAKAMDGSHHAADPASAQHDMAHAQHLGSADTDPAQADTGCSVCAACFVGAALPASEGRFAAHDQPQRYSVGIVAAVQHTSLDGPERPPRTSLD